jgi:abequosyltransferase
MTILLSICIPSYNRAKFLPDLLSSIVSQYDDRVEVVVCDNGSVDDTQKVMLDWVKKHPRIIYDRIPVNVGPDRCFLRSIEQGSGVFCWFMGDDDVVEPGGIKTVLEALDEQIEGITVNRVAYDLSLQRKWKEKEQGPYEDKFFSSAPSCFLSLFIYFGFLSAQVVRRDSFLSIVKKEDVTAYFNAYSLIYIIGRMIQKKPSWKYIHFPCVGWRSGNDSFASELGQFGRFKLDVIGYTAICLGLFGSDKKLHKKILKRVCSLHFFGHVRGLKLQKGKKTYAKESIFLCLRYVGFISSFWYKVLPVLLIPSSILRGLRPLYRKMVKKQVELVNG